MLVIVTDYNNAAEPQTNEMCYQFSAAQPALNNMNVKYSEMYDKPSL